MLVVCVARAGRRSCQGYVGGAGAVAVDDGRQPLHVGPEHLGHGLLLGFAQLREFLGDMRHRAVMLADLHAVDEGRPTHPGGGGDVAGLGQRAGDPLGGRLDVGSSALPAASTPARIGVDAAPGERANRVLSPDLPQLPHRGRRQVVVGMVELGPAGRSQPVTLRGPPAANLLPGGRGRRLGVARLDQRVQVTPHTGGRQAQLVADLTGGDRSGLQQQAHDGATGVAIRHDRLRGMRASRSQIGRIFTTPV